MDLATDYWYTGVLLLCSGHLHKVLDGCFERCGCWFSCLFTGCILNEGGEESLLLAGDTACQVW